MVRWQPSGAAEKTDREPKNEQGSGSDDPEAGGGSNKRFPAKWSLGILNDKETDEVPGQSIASLESRLQSDKSRTGSILLLSKVHDHNEPLGLHREPGRTSTSSLPSQSRSSSRGRTGTPVRPGKKTTADGKTILEPQPDDTPNDPLQWPLWRRNAALLSLGFYCLVGGGMTPILAAGFNVRSILQRNALEPYSS